MGKSHVSRKDSREALVERSLAAATEILNDAREELQEARLYLAEVTGNRTAASSARAVVQQDQDKVARLELLVSDLTTLQESSRTYLGPRAGKERWCDGVWLRKDYLAAAQLLTHTYETRPGAVVTLAELCAAARPAFEIVVRDLQRVYGPDAELPDPPSVRDRHYADNIIRTLRRVYVGEGDSRAPLFSIQSTQQIRAAGGRVPKKLLGLRLTPKDPGMDVPFTVPKPTATAQPGSLTVNVSVSTKP